MPAGVVENVGSGSNLELKAKSADLDWTRERIRVLGAEHQGIEQQVDEYYEVPVGRLKLRTSSLDGSHLIVYMRQEDVNASVSSYHRLPVSRPEELASTLAAMLGERARVEKEREVWWWRDIRIHLDRVSGLGEFVEFEARLDRIGDAAEAERRIESLREHLGIENDDLLGGSYGDMIEALE